MILSIHPFNYAITSYLHIHGYGIAIALSVLVLFACITYHVRHKASIAVISSLFSNSIIIGCIGGKILHIISEPHLYKTSFEYLQFWKGGFSIFGTIIALALYIPPALYQNNLPLLPSLDIVARFAPLAHAIGRLGCLWAGCCYGCTTSLSSLLAVRYTHTTIKAPVGVPLIPAQLYSSLSFLALFIIVHYIVGRYTQKPGILLCIYIIGLCIERFCMDFIRSDRIITGNSLLSMHQWIALAIAIGTLSMFGILYSRIQKKHVVLQ